MNNKAIVALLCVTVLLNSLYITKANADSETFEENYAIAPGAGFEIRNRDGKIRIEGWNGDQVKVRAVKQSRWGGKLENVKIEVLPGVNFSIETIHLVNNPKVSVSFDIQVPTYVKVERVKTSNGKIVLTRTHGDTTVESSNGKIEIDDVVGSISASTSNGAISISRVKGFVSAETSNGAIDIEGVEGVVSLETSNGAIHADVPAIGNKGLRVRTNNGKIELNFASNLNADIEAKTSNSDIELDGIEVVAKEISRSRLRGKIGEGGKKIICKTSNGAIVLGKLASW
jgi:DUF4097 and DUF4098 domain-containing protein YvlB